MPLTPDEAEALNGELQTVLAAYSDAELEEIADAAADEARDTADELEDEAEHAIEEAPPGVDADELPEVIEAQVADEAATIAEIAADEVQEAGDAGDHAGAVAATEHAIDAAQGSDAAGVADAGDGDDAVAVAVPDHGDTGDTLAPRTTHWWWREWGARH